MRYSDSTLMRMTKAELIEQLRCAEHNQEAAAERLARQAENVKDWTPVVCCKECALYGDEPNCPLACAEMRDDEGNLPHDYDYCSRAERKRGTK